MGIGKDTAQKYLRKLQSNDARLLAKSLGVRIQFDNLGKGVLGYFTRINRIPTIVVNDNIRNEFMIDYTIVHECGHRIIHPHINAPLLLRRTLFSEGKHEREANEFTVYYLIGTNTPEDGETLNSYLARCGIPEEFHKFY